MAPNMNPAVITARRAWNSHPVMPRRLTPMSRITKPGILVADHQQGFSGGLFQCIFHSPLYPLCARVMWMDMKMGADISIGLETIASPVNH